jgi:hypothetical protein
VKLAVGLLLLSGLLLAVWVGGADSGRPPCRHGASSVGPVTISHGRAAGSTTPHRTGCAP